MLDLINTYEQRFKNANAIFLSVDKKLHKSDLNIFQLVLSDKIHYDSFGKIKNFIALELMIFARE